MQLKNVADVYPLTSMQQLMLIHALRNPDSPLLEEQLACTLEGPLDVPAVERAWQRAIDRHPALRTAVVWQGLERPLQIVREQVTLTLNQYDWSELPAGEQNVRLAGDASGEDRRRFVLSQAPLMRLDLIRLADQRHRFVCRAHHLLFDGWSLAVLLREVLADYQSQQPRVPHRDAERRPAGVAATEDGLPRPSRTGNNDGTAWEGHPPMAAAAPGFRNYVEWLERQDAAAAEAFWRESLAGVSPTPIGQRVSGLAEASEGYHRRTAYVPAGTVSELLAWARGRQLTPGTLVHAAWALLLARRSGCDDVVFGTTVSGRPADLPDVEAIVGPFINNLPLRVALDRTARIAPWLQEVQSRLAAIAAYQHVALSDIERCAGLPVGARLFDSLVVFENHPLASISLEGLADFRVREMDVSATTTSPLALIAVPGHDWSLELRCDRQRFDSDDAEPLLDELVEFLQLFPRLAEQPLSNLLLQGAAAQHPRWNFDRREEISASSPLRVAESGHDSIEATLTALWCSLLGRETISPRDSFFDLGGNSLLAVRLMSEVERLYGRKLPLVWLFQEPTILRLADVLRAGDQPAECLAPIRPMASGMRTPLFCIHPAGGTVFCYRELARHLSDDVPVYGLQARGIDGREPPRARLEEMAADYAAELRAVQPKGPYQILGWSLGGLVAFETARQLAEAGEQIGLLAVIDAGMVGPDQKFSEDDFLPMLMQLFPHEYRPALEELQGLSAAQQLDFFRVRAEQAQLVGGGDSPIQDQHVFQVFQANMSALLEYRPRTYPGRLTLFRAAQLATPLHSEPALGWLSWALGGVEEHPLEGEHVNLFQPPYVAGLAEQLTALLDGHQ
ncbi:MAG TPA: alpha/beta fold hydrolase [Pirellulales bacterium]|nr:alpha/beta fold hydrolase [Pirellulales bacterium]